MAYGRAKPKGCPPTNKLGGANKPVVIPLEYAVPVEYELSVEIIRSFQWCLIP